MARARPLWPASGGLPRRGAAALLPAILVTFPGPLAAQRIAYPPVARDTMMLRGQATPRIAYLPRPVDPRLAPDDFAFDADEEEPAAATPEEQARAAAVLGVAQPVQAYRPRPALWRVIARHPGPDTVLYLFGTIHVLPPGFGWRSPAVERAAAASDTLILESVGGRTAEPGTTLDRVPLARRVSRDHRHALTRFLDGLPPRAAAELETMPTWMVAVAVGYVRDIQSGETPGPGADDWLEATFRARGKPVDAIEDGAQVMARLGAIPEADQRRMLDAALDATAPSLVARRAPLDAWAKGEVGPGSALTLDLDRRSGAEALNAPLLAERNRVWAAALATRLQHPGTAFFAAGIGHFIGSGSVLDLLRQHGIRVQRIN